MKSYAARMWTFVFVFLIVVGVVTCAQQPPWGFVVFDQEGRPRMNAQLQQSPYKPGMEPTVSWNFQTTTAVRDTSSRVISGFGFYGWADGATVHVAAISQLPPDGAENKFYAWPELIKRGLKPRMELFATYTATAGETKTMEELKALGAGPASVRIETGPPK